MTRGKLRLLLAADLPSAMELSHLAGWNQTIDDWQTLSWLDPEGCLGIEVDDRIVATTTLLCYGRRLAWIGMVLTMPDYRRMVLRYGGEGGIRTPGRSFGPYNGLANRRIQPLCHLSAACFQQLTTGRLVHLLNSC
jgi:hypothetical protein